MGEKPFNLEVRKNLDQGALVEASGYLDAHTVPGFEDRINRIIDAGGRKLILDLEKLQYISSAGIGAIMSVVQRLRRESGDLVLMNPSQKVHRILDLLGFADIFRIAHNEDEAREALSKSATPDSGNSSTGEQPEKNAEEPRQAEGQ